MKVDNPTANPDCQKGAYTVRFEERQIEDIPGPANRPAFERVREVSQLMDSIYSATSSGWVKAFTTPLTAAAMESLHPMRLSRQMFGSSWSPAMAVVRDLAAGVRKERHSVPDDAPLRKQEEAWFEFIGQVLAQARSNRDEALQRLFDWLYGRSLDTGLLQAAEDHVEHIAMPQCSSCAAGSS